MNREKKKLTLPLIVEGKYDKCTLSSLFSGLILTLGGFSIFNSKEKQAALRKISQNGVILLTDSDGGGRQLRSFISGIIPPDKLFHLYIPKIKGKEKRKAKASREGYLGVEGMEPELLLKLLSPFTTDSDAEKESCEELRSSRLYMDGFTGRDNSSEARAGLCRYLSLPEDMSAKALLGVINLLNLQSDYFDYVNNHLQKTNKSE